MDRCLANSVRSGRKQPQRVFSGSLFNLPLTVYIWRMNNSINDQKSTEYRVLARTYRPQTFSDLIGQDTLVKTLGNALKQGRLAHAFILTGVRGVGKTTTARIIAKGLNCIGTDGLSGPTINPCGVCSNCCSITDDRHVDVIEMDAASRTGIDDIREIIDGVRYKPVSGRYKIYIIDEVHMLSRNAFNALLKTLEEPPENVKFIFATTEIRKVPVTVLSRCQRFDLRRITQEDLIELFLSICQKEDITAENEPLRLIARAADGSARDGLSLLDQAMALVGGHITTESVQKMLGLSSQFELFEIFEELMGGQLPKALSRVAKLNELGADPLQIAQDLLAITHLVTKFKVAPEIVGRSVTDLESEKSNDLASRLPMVQLGRCWQMLIKGISEIQQASSSLPALEMVLIRLAYLSDLAVGEAIAEEKKPDVKKKINEPEFVESINPQIALANDGNFSEEIDGSVITSFEEIVDLFERKKEGLMHAKLVTNVRPVRMTPGRLEIMQTAEIDEKFVGQMGKLLSNWSGQDWVISTVQEEGQKTIQEQVMARDKDIKLEALRDPLVASVIEAFPGAEVTAVRPLLSSSSDTKINELDIATDNT